MPKLAKIQRCQRLPENTTGRDFVVGDLHGHRGLFEQCLSRLGFDAAHDRVFSVGDLVDRGPESLATMALIEQPWFHAVLGNHELMLLNYLGFYSSRQLSRKAYGLGAGAWVLEAQSRHRRALRRLAERLAALPLAIHVEGVTPFNVLHGDLQPLGGRQEALDRAQGICIHRAEAVANSRHQIAEAWRSKLSLLNFGCQPVQISATPRTELPLTYAGHTPVRQITVHGSYVFIDQGAGERSARPAGEQGPTVIEHRELAYWLGGVLSARVGGAPGGAARRQREAVAA